MSEHGGESEERALLRATSVVLSERLQRAKGGIARPHTEVMLSKNKGNVKEGANCLRTTPATDQKGYL